MPESQNNIIATRVGRVGHILLNRERARNALSIEMVRGIDRALIDWQDDDTVEAIVITGAGDRAFCAGGDVKSVYLAGIAGDAPGLSARFLRRSSVLPSIR